MSNLPRIGIIGGGIFGITTSKHLYSKYNVTFFEQFDDILCGSTYANHNRHHYGFVFSNKAAKKEFSWTQKLFFRKDDQLSKRNWLKVYLQ